MLPEIHIMKNRTNWVLLTLVIAVAVFLLIEAVLIWHVRFTDYDEAVFLDIARNIRRLGLPLRSVGEDGVLFFNHTPLYLYVVTASVMVFGENQFLLRLVTTLFGAGAIILSYGIVRRSQSVEAAFVTAVLVALNAFFALYAYFLTMEVPMTFLIILALYWLACADETPDYRQGYRYLALAGFASALAILLKELAVIFVGAAALYVFATGRTWRERIVRPFWLLLPLLLALGLWVMWGFNLDAVGFKAGIAGWFRSALGTGGIVDARSRITLVTWLSSLSRDVFGVGLVVLFLASFPAYFFFFRRRLPRIILLVLLYIALALAASILVRLKEPRHLMAVIPMMSIAIGLLVDWQHIGAWVQKKRIRWVVTAVLVLLFAWQISPLKLPPPTQWQNRESWWEPLFSNRLYRSQYYYSLVRETGDYLAQTTPPDAIIAVIHEGPVLGYYADRHHYFLYTMSLSRTIEVLDSVNYLVIDNFIFPMQTEEEKEQVRTYIDLHFHVVKTLEDVHRQIHVYQRNAAEVNQP